MPADLCRRLHLPLDTDLIGGALSAWNPVASDSYTRPKPKTGPVGPARTQALDYADTMSAPIRLVGSFRRFEARSPVFVGLMPLCGRLRVAKVMTCLVCSERV